MPAKTHKENLAARMGRWSADHWKTATFGWLAFVVVAFALGMAGTKSIDPNTAGPRESGRMDRILDAGFKRPAAESVLIQSRTLSTTDPAFSLTTTNAAATAYTLKVMTWVAVVFTPIVLGYQAWTYWVFRRRISVHHIPSPVLADAAR